MLQRFVISCEKTDLVVDFSPLPHPNTKVTLKRQVQHRPLTHSDREVAFVHCSAVPNIVRDITGVAKLIIEIGCDLNIFLAGSLFIGEYQAKRTRRCWRKLYHGSPTISVWGCPMGSAAWLRAERSTCGTSRSHTFFDGLTLNHAAPLKV